MHNNVTTPIQAAANSLRDLKALRERVAVAADAGYQVALMNPREAATRDYLADLGWRTLQATAKLTGLEQAIAWVIQTLDKQTSSRLSRKVDTAEAAVHTLEKLVGGGMDGLIERRNKIGPWPL